MNRITIIVHFTALFELIYYVKSTFNQYKPNIISEWYFCVKKKYLKRITV